jgi:acetyl-CoA carboxylase carboxyl transferase subunit alpha
MQIERWLEIEEPLYELRQTIDKLRATVAEGVDNPEEMMAQIEEFERQWAAGMQKMHEGISPWNRVELARHPRRPYTLDYINAIFDDFIELHGDRRYGDDPAIVAGLARMQERSVAVVGHQKGRTAAERRERNFGMARPWGYRKALRIAKLAEQLGQPLISFVDTPGAWCLEDAEATGICEAIAFNQREFSRLRTPIVVVVIGEGGSGGAIGIGVGDHIIMLENSYYSVIAPESCASILWRDSAKAPQMAEALRLTAEDALGFGVIDEVLEEPLGGAHWAPREMAATIHRALDNALQRLEAIPKDELVERRYRKFMAMGQVVEE